MPVNLSQTLSIAGNLNKYVVLKYGSTIITITGRRHIQSPVLDS
jgi:hypothetical protein